MSSLSAFIDDTFFPSLLRKMKLAFDFVLFVELLGLILATRADMEMQPTFTVNVKRKKNGFETSCGGL